MEEILLQFDFKDKDYDQAQLQFTKPERVFTTDQVDQVIPLLEQLEAEHNRGMYIAGYISYEAAQAFVPNYRTMKQLNMPLVWFASFEAPVKLNLETSTTSYTISNWQATMSKQQYYERINLIKAAIERGDTGQINFTTQLTNQFSGDSYRFYQQLLENQQASYSAYLDIGRFKILSASPELFFKIKQNKVTTRPMKGTIKRGRTLAEDRENKDYLLNSDKERAENLMIVDVLKHDLSKLAVPGSIEVPELLTVETYPTLHQMTSTITAQLNDTSRIVDWFKALFPCGSITGTPRLETMKMIDQLEITPREVYCGAIGYITPERDAIFNVPIRTVVIDREQNMATYGVGGGITAGSEAANEYAEIKTKAAILTAKNRPFSLIESIRLTEGQYPYLDTHLDRLAESAEYFSYRFNRTNTCEKLIALAKQLPVKDYKVRLLLKSDGDIQLDSEEINLPLQPVKSYLAPLPIDKENRYLYHKTTIRDHYQKLEVDAEDNFSTLLWNDDGELTEFTIGNIVLKIADQYLTPPVDVGLLPGVFRQILLEEGRIKEARLTKADLERADEIWLINAVRGWVEIETICK